MEFFKNNFEKIKSTITPKEKEPATWESKNSALSKNLLRELDDDFTKINTEIIGTKIKFLGRTEGGQAVLSSGLSRKELISSKEIGETEGGGVVYGHSPLYNYIKEASGLIKNWQEQINSEELTESEKKMLSNILKVQIQAFKNNLFDIRHQSDPDKIKKDVFKKAKLYSHEESLKKNELNNIDEYVTKIQNLAETYSSEESSDDSIRQAVVLIARISAEENTEPKKLIFDLKTIFAGPDKKDINVFYEKLMNFFEATKNTQKEQVFSINKDDDTQIMGPAAA